ncbi:NAD(P)-binding protein [Cylindrobasidium torrendii FP15055 ss-10]|uniref:NAD(P)-binding protein n=1 Tax=Cylindrobasidium torrendii FP15055 ss-10 TaxID=1314674 RepID=A0A0D7B1S8_9AGAR|nr:NAD(P)-binding protein [Cylindrobasidium torrendii FP15055 ss-10]
MSTSPHILLLGGHGKIALYLTPRLISRGWTVTSVVRNPDHEADIHAAAPNAAKGALNVLVSDLAEISTQEAAQAVIDTVRPTWVVWSAGAGGKGGDERTHQIDYLAAAAFIRAAAATDGVTTFLMVSANNSRRSKPSWWSDEEWAGTVQMNSEGGILAAYFQAKINADELLTALTHKRENDDARPAIKTVILRPGWLAEREGTGKVHLGKTKGVGDVPREDVAETAARLLEAVQNGWKGGWVDLLAGDNEIGAEVERVVSSGETSIDGENIAEIHSKV